MNRIFVVGCPRSGTTVVQALIARHPDVYTLPETDFFEAVHGGTRARWGDAYAGRGQRWYHRHLGLAQSQGRRVLRTLERRNDVRRRRPSPWGVRGCTRRFIALLDELAQRADCGTWVEKTPQHLLYLEEIARSVPDARFVHVIRSGRDVLASIVDADMHQPGEDFSGGVVTWARRWNRALALSLAYREHPQHFLLCLEDLTRDFDGTWGALRDFLGLDPGARLLARPGSRVSSVDHAPWRRREMTGVIATPDRKYERLFGPESRQWIESTLSDYAGARRRIGSPAEQLALSTGS